MILLTLKGAKFEIAAKLQEDIVLKQENLDHLRLVANAASRINVRSISSEEEATHKNKGLDLRDVHIFSDAD